MKKKLGYILSSALLIFMFASTIIFTGCGSDENECGMCNGSGYYDHKTCPACKGSGSSDFDPYEIADDMYGEDDDEGGGFWVIVVIIIGGVVVYNIFKKKNNNN